MNIILYGVPRSGKSTFAKMILEKFPNYNYIEGDIVSTSLGNTMRDFKMFDILSNPKDNIEFSEVFIKNYFKDCIKYQPKMNFLLDSYFIKFEDLEDFDNDDNLIIVFGYPCITTEEAVENILKYDKEDDWTYIEPEWRLKLLMEKSIKNSKELKKICKKKSYKFVDVSRNREEVFNELLEWISNQINN